MPLSDPCVRWSNLPTSNSSFSGAAGRYFFQMSMVNKVELLLKIDVSDDMRAAIITAIIKPLRPAMRNTHTSSCTACWAGYYLHCLWRLLALLPFGISSMTSLGKARLEHPTSAPHTRTHSSGSTHPTESAKCKQSSHKLSLMMSIKLSSFVWGANLRLCGLVVTRAAQY